MRTLLGCGIFLFLSPVLNLPPAPRTIGSDFLAFHIKRSALIAFLLFCCFQKYKEVVFSLCLLDNSRPSPFFPPGKIVRRNLEHT